MIINMDESVGSTIEKIKLQEQDIENKLKEKREHEAELSALSRAIKDAVNQASKSDQERLEITERIQKLQPVLEIAKIRRRALSAQLETYTKVFEDLKAQSNQGIANVWHLRSSLCETVQSVSDSCDIWALLMRPVSTNALPHLSPQPVSNSGINDKILNYNESRLQAALQRRKDLEAERDMLLAEPDTGEDFIRIKNALRYLLQKIASLQDLIN